MSETDEVVNSVKHEGEAAPTGQSLFLRTKFHIPSIRSALVERPRLQDLIDQAADKPILLVSAPAGYGKTTLLGLWLKKTGIPAVWISLDAGDNDPVRFLQCMLAAIRPLAGTVGNDLTDMLEGIQPAQFDSFAALLANALMANPTPFVLVLDDVHAVRSPAVIKIIAFLLEHISPPIRLVLLTRTDPPLPLARLRAMNLIADIRAEQLRFADGEAALFLNKVMGLEPSADDIAALTARTEGWIAGLQLAALSMQHCRDAHAFVAAFTGSHHYVMDYLVEEVLKSQPPDAVAFLLQTSILDRMCTPLCNAVLGENAPATGAAPDMLESLERKGLFVVPLDDDRRWYRYHHLFSDVLQKHLRERFPQTVSTLYGRASQWYENNELTSEAIRFALLAREQERAARLIEENGCHLIISGEVATLSDWLRMLEFQAETRPWLTIQKAWALALTDELERAEQTLQIPERLIAPLESSPEVNTMRGTIAAARAHCANARGDTRAAADYARLALDLLPDSIELARTLRSASTSILGDACWINGELEEAVRIYTQAVRLGREAGNLQMVIIANTNLAELLIEQGRLHRAADVFAQSIQMAVRPDGQKSPLAGAVYTGLGGLELERNRLGEADQHIRQSLEIGRRWGDIGRQAISHAFLARLEQARGRPETAMDALRTAEQLAAGHPLLCRHLRAVESAGVRIRLAQGDVDWPSRFAREKCWTVDDEIPFQRSPEYLVFARVLSAQGEYDAVIRLCDRLSAQSAGRNGLVIEAAILRSLALQAKRNMEPAAETLAKALALAKPEGYVRVFLDEGEPMTRLLCLVRSRQTGSGYASGLLTLIEGSVEMTQPSMELLNEPLTARELEVLKLIEAGCSNQEISEKFVISIPTVKRHISNIYSKLGVKSRTQAIAIGKELNLFK